MLAVVDALAALMPELPGVTVDPAATEPFRPAAGRLYLWRRRLVPHGVDDEPSGRRDDAVLRMRALVVRGNKGEPRAQNANRATTDALEADLVRDWVSAHPAYGVTETKAAKRAKTAAPEPSLTDDGPADAAIEEGGDT